MCKYAFDYSSLSFFFFESARLQMQSIYLHVSVCNLCVP